MREITAEQLLVQMRAMAARAQGLSGTESESARGPDFSTLLRSALDRVNDFQQRAAELAAAFETGRGKVDLAEVMIAMQKASLSFEAATQVRNRLVSAYQEIMNMPV